MVVYTWLQLLANCWLRVLLYCSAYRPYPIMMGSILLADAPLGFYPFEVGGSLAQVLNT